MFLRNGNFRLGIFLTFLLLLTPVFLSLNFSNGMRFDASPFNYLGAPSLPLSFFIFPFLFLSSLFVFRIDAITLLFVIFLGGYLCLNLLYQSNYRPFFIFVGMVVPLLNYYAIKRIIFRWGVEEEAVDNFYLVLVFIVVLKFLFDTLLFGRVLTEYFLSSKVVIYNYYDYFSFVYFLSILFSIKMILANRYLFLALVTLVVSVLCIVHSYSRLFMVLSVITLPCFILFHYTSVSKNISIISVILFVFVATLLLSIVDLSYEDLSFVERVDHWKYFFNSFGAKDILFPFFNQYRSELNWGSFHNELLEIYSYFGVSIFLFFGVVLKLMGRIRKQWRDVAAVMVVGLLLGMLVQLNFTNPYLCVIWSSCLAALSGTNKERRDI